MLENIANPVVGEDNSISAVFTVGYVINSVIIKL